MERNHSIGMTMLLAATLALPVGAAADTVVTSIVSIKFVDGAMLLNTAIDRPAEGCQSNPGAQFRIPDTAGANLKAYAREAAQEQATVMIRYTPDECAKDMAQVTGIGVY